MSVQSFSLQLKRRDSGECEVEGSPQDATTCLALAWGGLPHPPLHSLCLLPMSLVPQGTHNRGVY